MGLRMSDISQSSRTTTQIAVAAAVFVGGLGLLALTVREWMVLNQERSVSAATQTSPEVIADILNEDTNASPEYLIRLAEELVAKGPENDETARALLTRALEIDEGRPFAWTLLAFVETRRTGRFNEDAKQAFDRSLEVCPYCEKDLLRWRLEFIISHWDDVSAETRDRVFRGADFLRWWYMDHEFLQTQKERAAARGIPFVAYQRAVNSKVRPEEIED